MAVQKMADCPNCGKTIVWEPNCMKPDVCPHCGESTNENDYQEEY